MSAEPALRDLQGWLQAVICHPDGVAAAAAKEARRWLNVPADALDDVVRPSAALTAEQRLGLYARSYQLRLLDCMRELHPALHHALGPALFDDFALDYLHANPSTSPTLFELDRGFADHLETTRPQSGHGEEPWPSLLVDLARLERLFLEVYDGPGVETVEIASTAALPSQLQPGWAQARVSAVPCLRLLASPYPVGRYLLDVRRGEQPTLPTPEACFLVLNRRDYVVVLHELSADAYRLLDALITGAPLGAAAAGAGIALTDAWQTVRGWAAHGYFQAIDPPGPKSDIKETSDARHQWEPAISEGSVARWQ